MTERRVFAGRAAAVVPVLFAWAVSNGGTAQELPVPRPVPQASPYAPTPPPGQPAAGLGLDDLIRLGLEQNPGLRLAGFEAAAAQGRAVQAGLYPNPTVSSTFDELGDRTGPKGINTVPLVTQEIVTGGKLGLSRSVAQREADQSGLAVVRQRFALFTAIRQAYFEVLAARRRVEVLGQLADLAGQSLEGARKLLQAKEIARLDLLQFQVERNRFLADLEAARRELDAAFRRLAAAVGVPDLPDAPLTDLLDSPLPDYDFDQARAFVTQAHPEVQSARVGVARAQLALRRAQVEPVPNVTVGAGYVRQNQNQSNDYVLQFGLPLPLYNRNQGNIAAAQAEVGRAVADVARAQNDLAGRLATAFGQYAAARQRAERYRTQILPDAREAFRLALEAFRIGQFDYLRVLQAQRAVAEANLVYVRALDEVWRAAGEISGLLLEEQWPRATR